MATSDVTASSREEVVMLLGAVSPEVKAIWVNVDGTVNISRDAAGLNPVAFTVVAGTALPVAGKDIYITSVAGLAITDLIGLNWGV